MTVTLDDIIAHKRIEVARAQTTTPLAVLKERVAEVGRPRNFFAALVDETDRSRTRVIAEVKRSSPSAGVIREEFDPVAIARAYEDAGAAAISCLTDEKFFGGHLGYIQQIRQAVNLPVLRKDFIVDEYQIWEARAAQADAILLIGDVLGEARILDFMILAKDLGMTTLLEVHAVETLLRLKRHVGFPHSGYGLLGINDDINACAPASIEAAVDDVLLVVGDGQAAEIGPVMQRLAAQGVNAVTLCIGAMRHFRTLHRAAVDTSGRPQIWGPNRDKMVAQARKWGPVKLEQALTELTDTDLQLRSAGQHAPALALVERTFIRLAMLAQR